MGEGSDFSDALGRVPFGELPLLMGASLRSSSFSSFATTFLSSECSPLVALELRLFLLLRWGG